MSRQYQSNHPHFNPPIVVHDHDVLNGRGVNIAHHPGNERFRSLVTTRLDDKYCMDYSASEKKAVAEEIVKHIQALDPPGRFLRRDGRGPSSRGLSGPWTELTPSQAVKKTCQALRDCNRPDRQGYAAGVVMPEDVVEEAERLESSGMTRKQAAATVAASKPDSSYTAPPAYGYVTPQAAAAAAAAVSVSLKREREEAFDTHTATALVEYDGRVSPSIEDAAVEWLKRQRTDEATATAATVPDLQGYPTSVAPHHHLHHHHIDPVDAQVMEADTAAAVFSQATDLLSAEDPIRDEDHDDVDAAISYQTHMALNAGDVHQGGPNML